jgi:NOL1/NOP2/fmu family ribosome biogenesis protein
LQNSADDAVEQARAYLADRFGVQPEASVLDGMVLKKVSDDVWLVPENHDTAYAVETYGIRCIRVQDIGLKPTTYALQLLEPAISRNVVMVDQEQVLALLDGNLVPIDAVAGDVEEGYVGIRHDDRLLGCGLYKNGTVSSRIPKGRGTELASFLDEKKSTG